MQDNITYKHYEGHEIPLLIVQVTLEKIQRESQSLQLLSVIAHTHTQHYSQFTVGEEYIIYLE